MLAQLSTIIIHFISSLGYPAIYGLMVMTAAMIPIPSEVIMPFAGFQAQQGHVNFILVVLVGVLGDLTGGLIAYSIGYYLEDRIVLSLIDKYGKYILFRKNEYEHALRWFDKYGNRVVFFGRIMPGIRTFMSLPAGLAKMPLPKFILYTFLGSTIWCTALASVGFYLGKNWESIHALFSKLEIFIGAVILIAIAFFVYKHLKRKKKREL